MVDSTVDNGQWLSLADAARVLGVSEKTARRRAKTGQLEARQIPAQHGPAWQVWVPTRVDAAVRVDSTVPSVGTQASTVAPAQTVADLPPSQDLAALVAVVDRLTVENRQLAEAAAVWQE